jgi:glycosyltransferase involved in cell wall biosynthesis
VSFVITAPDAAALPAADGGIPVVALSRSGPVDVAVATWWTTAEALTEIDAARRVVFLQSLESRFYRSADVADRTGALAVLDLPVDFIVVASHMRRLLERLRPDARCHLVPVGIDKRVFAPRAVPQRGDAPLRVLVEGQASLWFKGVGEAVSAVRAMGEPATLTLAMLDVAAAHGFEADRVVGGLSPYEMAALYAEHDVLLKLSRHEGLGLPPLEAMHVGLPCVLTPFTGSDDYARHGENALVVGIDDQPGTVALLDLLARDDVLRQRLSAGALETAAGWPDPASSARAFAEALRRIRDDPPPAAGPALRRMTRSRRIALEILRFEAEGHATWRNLAEERLALLYELARRPSYRAAKLAKRLVGRRSIW